MFEISVEKLQIVSKQYHFRFDSLKNPVFMRVSGLFAIIPTRLDGIDIS